MAKKKTYAASAPTSTQRTYSVAASGSKITVRAGDTLSKLALKHDVDGGWKEIYAANRDKINNPNLIFVGQVIRMPQ